MLMRKWQVFMSRMVFFVMFVVKIMKADKI